MWIITALMNRSFVDNCPSINNRKIEMFHSNTDSETKDRIMSDFTDINGNIKVLITTIAFGMGVNIRDVDIVVHWGLPASLLGYWQEIGRCGRDGRPSYAVCYAYKRSYCKLEENDSLRGIVEGGKCIRTAVLDQFLIDGMDSSEVENLLNLSNLLDCSGDCEITCICEKCSCCIFCQKQCKCESKKQEPLKEFMNC